MAKLVFKRFFMTNSKVLLLMVIEKWIKFFIDGTVVQNKDIYCIYLVNDNLYWYTIYNWTQKQ